MSSFEIFTKEHQALVEHKLDELTQEPPMAYAPLYTAARYCLLGGGKRLRPLLLFAAGNLLGVDSATLLQPACAIEVIHNYSLIHDDLPCADNDDYRRGKPTLHKVYPEWHALLTGDFLLTYAFELLTDSPNLTSDQKVKLIKTLSHYSGGHWMVAGQFLDLSSEMKALKLKELELIHHLKTAGLMIAALEMAAIIAEVPDAILAHLQKLGYSLGLGFQIVDDILDVTHPAEKHGNSAEDAISSDEVNGKTTYVSLLGLEGAQSAALQCYERALSALEEIPNSQSCFLQNLVKMVFSRV